MNKYIWLITMLAGFLLTSCFGFVPTGLPPAKPEIYSWNKPGISTEKIWHDWINCGGGRNGYTYGISDEGSILIDRCMIQKGYDFYSDCSYRKYRVACGGTGCK